MDFTLSCSHIESFTTFLQWVIMFDVHCGDTLQYMDDFLFVCPAYLDMFVLVEQVF